MTLQRCLLLASLVCSGAVTAGVYRCDQDGRISFSDRPCVAGQAPMEIIQPNTIETSASERVLAQQFDAETASLRSRRNAAEARRDVAHAAPESSSPKSPRKTSTKRPKAPKASKVPKPRPPSLDRTQALQKLAPPRPSR